MIDLSALDAAIQRPQPPMKRSTKSGSSAGTRSASRRDSFARNDDLGDPSNITHTDPRHKTSTTRTTQPSLRPRSSTSSSTLTKPTIKRRPGHARDLRSRSHPLQALAQALASPSVASLLSTLTTQTSSSSGSNSTIRPDPSRQRPATGGASSSPRDHHRDPLYATRQPLEYNRPAGQAVDVFQYLQTESGADTAASPSLPAGHQYQPSASDPDSASDSDSKESSAETAPSSLSRSSSVHSTSTANPPLNPGTHSRTLDTHVRLKASERSHLQTESPQAASERNSSLHTGTYNFVGQRGEGVDGTDNASLPPITLTPMTGEQRASQMRPRSSQSQTATPLHSTLAMAWLSDVSRDLLNCQLMPAYHRFLSIFCREGTVAEESRPVPRPYRRFEHLNHRVLACLQDEVAVLENRLAILDGLIATCRLQDAAIQPDFQRRVGNLHFQRTEMIANIHVKINKYNQALASYNALLRDTVPASVGSIQQHASRRRASTTTAVDLAQHTGDLVNLSNARPTSGGDDATILALIIVPPIALTATWLTFACMSGVFTAVLAFFGIMATALLMFNLDLRLCHRFDKRLFLGAGMSYAILLICLAVAHS